ncbi:predicted protein [Pyrenophora tritici-repentis Pt-1C-BFP]|uniref:Uncharacterized protein n=1 Tax=Pyrenophora tritici-repentis (strain Pt-1C-BFP) TaxID=426418 RepID=B2W212_PYRTR|nr:uncharacterized protein PTRG_03460 [Pyrenophora tritici-repentis Pt-1C-BFP]EDU46298.1 predicted protein [Pyrenophora tritici-repentis Pt-1C-BFP]
MLSLFKFASLAALLGLAAAQQQPCYNAQPFVIILCLYNSMTAIGPVVQSAIFRAATPVMAAIRQADNWIAPGAYERGS